MQSMNRHLAATLLHAAIMQGGPGSGAITSPLIPATPGLWQPRVRHVTSRGSMIDTQEVVSLLEAHCEVFLRLTMVLLPACAV